MRGSFHWTAFLMVLGGLGFCGKEFLRRRTWNCDSRFKENEAIRRHVNRSYD
jgi:hypothetical protein